ncbi:MAG: discoidin domain-containing protein, partial [Thermomicrobiales bacterium]
MVLVVLAVLATRADAAAQGTPQATTCVVSREPNDTVANAVDLGTGAACATAENAGGGGQDVYRWTVPADQPAARWTITTTDIAGQASIIEVYSVQLDAAGTVTAATKLVSAAGGSGKAAGLRDLIWQPGTYYVGVAASGPGPYTLTIARGTPEPAQNDASQHDTPDTAIPVQGAFALTGDRTGTDDVFAWTLDAGQAARHWTVQIQAPVGSGMPASLADASGTVLFSGYVGANGVLDLPDLGLAAGTYLIRIQQVAQGPAPYRLAAVEGPPRDAQHEDEPNDATPMPFALTGDSTTMMGRLTVLGAAQDTDTYALTISAADAGRYLDIRGIWPDSPSRKLCLQDANKQELRCVEGDHGAALSDLALKAGSYVLVVSGDPADAHPYVLKAVLKGAVAPGFESEPNETIASASALVPDGKDFVGSGRLSPTDRDTYVVEVSGEPHLWTIEVTGDGVGGVYLLDASGSTLMSRTVTFGNPVIRIYDAFLVPGKHWVQVQGKDGDYTVRMIDQGPPDPNQEHEPNDTLVQSQPIVLGAIATGRVPDTTDADTYRFSLQNQTYVRIEVQSPPDAQLGLRVDSALVDVADMGARAPGENLVYDLMLPMGDYSVVLVASVPSESLYHLRISVLDPLSTPADLEPNGNASQARPFPANLHVQGVLNPALNGADTDWYRLPDSLLGAHITYAVTSGVSMSLVTVGSDGFSQNPIASTQGSTDGVWTADLPAEGPVYVVLTGSTSYQVAIATGNATPPAAIAASSPEELASPVVALASPVASPVATVASDAPVRITLALPATEVAAFWQDGQRIDADVALQNVSDTAITLHVSLQLGNVIWTSDLPKDAITIQPGETSRLTIPIHVAPDAWANQPVYVAVGAIRDDGSVAGSAFALVTPRTNAVPVNIEDHPPLPDALLGGLDAAWSGLGGQAVLAPGQDATAVAQLIDGHANSGMGWRESTTALPQDLTVQLAGDQPVPVAGFVLDPRGWDDIPSHQVAEFEIDLSSDGVTFRKAVSGTLSIAGVEQAFVLDAPVNARFARLRVISAQDPTPGTIHLGEWKVIAQAGWQPAPSAGTPVPAGGAGLDLASFDVGGHIVDVQPPIGSTGVTRQMAIPGDGRQTVAVTPGATVSWITGFQDDRAALLTSMTWVDPAGSDPTTRIDA